MAYRLRWRPYLARTWQAHTRSGRGTGACVSPTVPAAFDGLLDMHLPPEQQNACRYQSESRGQAAPVSIHCDTETVCWGVCVARAKTYGAYIPRISRGKRADASCMGTCREVFNVRSRPNHSYCPQTYTCIYYGAYHTDFANVGTLCTRRTEVNLNMEKACRWREKQVEPAGGMDASNPTFHDKYLLGARLCFVQALQQRPQARVNPRVVRTSAHHYLARGGHGLCMKRSKRIPI